MIKNGQRRRREIFQNHNLSFTTFYLYILSSFVTLSSQIGDNLSCLYRKILQNEMFQYDVLLHKVYQQICCFFSDSYFYNYFLWDLLQSEMHSIFVYMIQLQVILPDIFANESIKLNLKVMSIVFKPVRYCIYNCSVDAV